MSYRFSSSDCDESLPCFKPHDDAISTTSPSAAVLLAANNTADAVVVMAGDTRWNGAFEDVKTSPVFHLVMEAAHDKCHPVDFLGATLSVVSADGTLTDSSPYTAVSMSAVAGLPRAGSLPDSARDNLSQSVALIPHRTFDGDKYIILGSGIDAEPFSRMVGLTKVAVRTGDFFTALSDAFAAAANGLSNVSSDLQADIMNIVSRHADGPTAAALCDRQDNAVAEQGIFARFLQRPERGDEDVIAPVQVIAALSSSSAPLNTKSSNVSPVPRQEEARGRCHGGDEEPHSGGLPPQHQHRRSLYDHVDDWHSTCVANNNQHHVDRLDSSSFSPSYSSSSAAKNPAGTPSTTAEHAAAGGSTRSSVATTPSRRVAVRSTSVAADNTPSHPSSSANKRRKYVHNPYASRTNDGNATAKTPVAAVNPATPTSSPSSQCCATRSFSTTTAAADPMKVQIATDKNNNLDVFRVLAVDLPPGCTMGDLLALLKSYTPRRNVWMDSSNNSRAYALFDTPLQGYVAYAALDNTSIGTTGPFRFFPEGQLCFSSAGGARRPQLRADYMSDRLFDVAHTKARRQVGDGVVPSSKLNGLWGRYVHNAGDENYGQFQLGRGLLVPPPSRLTPVPYPPPPPPSPGSFNQIYGTFIDVYEDRLRKTGVIGPRRRKDLHF